MSLQCDLGTRSQPDQKAAEDCCTCDTSTLFRDCEPIAAQRNHAGDGLVDASGVHGERQHTQKGSLVGQASELDDAAQLL